MKYLLDTDICIYLIKKRSPPLIKKILTCKAGDLAISAITLAELEYGVAKSIHQDKNRLALATFITPLHILPFDAELCRTYAELRATLETHGTPIGPYDMLIAAHALHVKCPLVTNNTREFSRIPKLKIENWTTL